MNRKEIVEQIGHLEVNHCKVCTRLKSLHQTNRENICLKNCEIGNQLSDLGKQLLGESGKKYAKKGRDNPWTDEEKELLLSDKTSDEIAKLLGRTVSSVTNRRRRVRVCKNKPN